MDITDICVECKNYFLKNGTNDVHSGTYTISNGTITPLDFIKPGQYFKIEGSVSNDRVICNTAEDLLLLVDETFDGAIWAMYVPPNFVKLCEEIQNWIDKYTDAVNSPYAAESFKGYSRSLKSGANGGYTSWQNTFASRLNMYRRVNLW